jgi:hypothetical protein
MPLFGLSLLLLLAVACAAEPTPTATQPPALTPTATTPPAPPTPTATTAPKPTATPTTAAVATPATVAAITGDLVIALKELNASGQKGIAVLTAKGSQTEVLILATADISELNHIHTGSCAVVGGVVHPIPNMVAGKSLATVNATLDSLLTGGFAIRLHKKGDASTYVSCADIPAKANALTVQLKELNSSGQSGLATLVAVGDKTNVALYASAGVSELNHIHSGTCAVVGGVVHPIPNMVNGIAVATVNVKLDSLQTGAFAVRLHKKGEGSVYTACADIPAKSTATVAAITGDLVIALKELTASGQKGIAVLTAKGSQTEVLLIATADISELNHIHTGSCAVVGGVVHPIPNMVAGRTSATVNATLDSLLTGGFAIRLHKKGDGSVYTSCGDIPTKANALTVQLKELNSSGQSGVATLVAVGDKTDVAVYATAGVSELNHIHSSTCAIVGGVVHPIPNMVNGIAVATVNVTLDSLQTGAFAVRLHKKGEGSVYTACADIPAKSTATVAAITGDLVIALKELTASGQKGIAVLTAKGSQTEVLLIATADISELNHIHTGSCAVVGGVVHPIPNMVAGRTSATVNATLDSLLTGGFAIRLHKKGDGSVYTSCGDIPTKANALTVQLKELNSSGQSGVATLVAVGDKTDVAVYATAGVSELNHIHSSTCAVVGGVVHPIPNMVNGIAVATVNVKLDSLQTGAFAVRLHKKGEGSVYTACADIPAKSTVSSGTTPTAFQATIKNSTLLDITIPVGTTVTWANGDTVAHILGSGKDGKFDAGGWKSPNLNAGQSYSQTFSSTGTISYTCQIHPTLNGTVTVAPAGTPSSSTPASSGDATGGGGSSYY